MQEFDLIEKIRKGENLIDGNLVKGIGDDCAVIDRGRYYELVTTDMLVEGDHFRLDWATPKQIGAKAAEVNLSDIAAMGGIPQYAFISLCLSKEINENWVTEFYKGLKGVFKREKVIILGGDTTHGSKVVINIALIGEVLKKNCCFRSGAKVGDKIFVTGFLGGSTAGLKYLESVKGVQGSNLEGRAGDAGLYFVQKGQKGFINYCLKKHFDPRANVKEGQIIAKYANAMIDISDGLGSEISHICKESKVGARIYDYAVPIYQSVKKMGEFLESCQRGQSLQGGQDNLIDLPMRWAMSGGEDFELLFTIPLSKIEALSRELRCFPYWVGEIVDAKEGVKFDLNHIEIEMPGGYEHFKGENFPN